MKSYILILAAAFTTSVLGSPYPVPGLTTDLESRGQCYHPSECKWTNSGQCEYHCDGYGGFMYMQGCGLGRKRCCCGEPTE